MGKDETNPATPEPVGWAIPGVGCAPTVDLLSDTQHRCENFIGDATGQDLGAQLVRMRRLIDSLEAVWLSACADFDQAGGPAEDGATSLAAWLRHRCQLAPGEAQSRARVP